METEMQRLFANTGIVAQGSSFFMPQEEEGRLEFLGTQAMYTNLEQAGQLEKVDYHQKLGKSSS